MIYTRFTSGPRSKRARRMCQYACLPAPKTVIVLTCLRLLKTNSDVSAVRNAVRSCALIRPMGRPSWPTSVNVPRGDESRAPTGGHALPERC